MSEWISQFYPHVMHMISAGNLQDLGVIFLVASLTEVGIPFPLVLDTLLFLLGYQIAGLWFTAILVVLVLLAGREIGASAVYWTAKTLGSPLIRWLGKRFPGQKAGLDKFLKRSGIKTAVAFALSRIGTRTSIATSASSLGLTSPLTVSLARLTPGLLTVTSVASGIAGFRYKYFVLGIGIASVTSDLMTVALGAVTGYGLREFSIAPSSWLILVAIGADIGLMIGIQYFLRRRFPRVPA